MATSEGVVGTMFCTACGSRTDDGVCPAGCAPRPAVPVLSSRPDRIIVGREVGPVAAPWQRGLTGLLPVVVSVLALAAAAAAAVVAYTASAAADRSEAAVQTLTGQQSDLRDRVEALAATRRNLTDQLVALQRQAATAQRPDVAATVKQAARSVFTVTSGNSSGSAFVVSAAGATSRLVTNFHVVADSYVNGVKAVTVRRGQLSYPGRIVDVSESNDLALVKVDTALPPLPVEKKPTRVGDELLVLGSPLGLGGTVTSGIVSAHRNNHGVTLLQFSAPISPGNSGGPVLTTDGRVVGVAVSKMVGDGAEGLGFAIPTGRLCTALSVC